MTNNNFIIDTPYKDKGEYKVPQNYFETLNKRILENVEKQKQPKKTSFFHIPMMRYAVAAALTALAISTATIGFYFNNDTDNNSLSQQKDMLHKPTKHYANTDTSEYNDECIDYVMMGKDDFYAYVIDE